MVDFPRLFVNCHLSISLLHTDDATRVKLLEGPDYINANYVNVSLFMVMFSHPIKLL